MSQPHLILYIIQEAVHSPDTVHRGQDRALSPQSVLCVRGQKEAENERAYCTGVHVCVHYCVTSALLYLFTESSGLKTTQ